MRQNELLQKCEQMLLNRCTPEIINELKENEIFVFGSKPDGNHKSGAAKTAVEKFGAIEGVAEGLVGQSYAIPVHRHRIQMMTEAVARFIEFAKSEREKTFYVLPIGCGNANMDVNVVAKMFTGAASLDNIFLPAMFIKAIRKSVVIPEDEELPIKYVGEIINADRLRGRMMGLMAEVSKRTEQPITFDDEILKKDNIFLFAFLRIAKVVTKEEQRVMNALIDEAKKMSETELGKESDNGTVRALELVHGWKLEANKILEDGGTMYDLLTFTNPQYILSTQEKQIKKGSHEKLEDGNLKIFNDKGKFGLKNNDEVVIIPAEYDQITHAGWRGRGWHLKKDGKWGAVNERGEWMFEVEFDEIKTRYEGGHFLRKNGKMGFCDSKGVVTIDFLYDELENYSSSWDGAKAKIDNKWGYVDGEGNIVVPVEYDYVSLDGNGMIGVKKDGKYGFYNINDGLIIPIEYDYVHSCFTSSHPNEAVANRNETWGVINTQGATVLPFVYDSISIDAPNEYRVHKDGLSGIIDKDGKVLFPFKYKDLGAFDKNGVTYAQNSDGLYGYIDKEDHLLIPFSYKKVRDFHGEYAEVSMDRDKVGVINKKGEVVVPLRFNEIHICWDDIIEVLKDDRENYRYLCGLYDLKNGYTLPCIYERISPRGRNREGILECECWKDRRGEPVLIKVNSRNNHIGGRIAIARDFAIVLKENDWELEIVGHNPDFRQLCRTTRNKFVKLAAGFDGYMALTDDGHVHVGPRAEEFERGMEIEQLRDVVDIVGCEGHTVVLHSDSTVTCIDEPCSYEGPDAFANEVRNWNGIVQVACGFDFVAGLKSDGTLISVGRYYHCPNWDGIVQFDAFNCYYGQIYTIALLDNGRVVSDYTDEVSEWRDVIKVRVGNNGFAVGLTSDGTAYAIGEEDFVRDVQSWRNIVDIECKFNHAVAILSNGRIVSTGF